ncbi:iron-containing alcohol dehydrogenase family protein [Adlercreutzia sp. ZJ138]|uniref:iron-containing alcohol dehydrogenase family protein n=1 Tax=Adlercreutzia sp. ZJ138 TaxID=2709405 RepID=UPI0013EA9420|nr:iron-containing alcohol dehydrogenase family protein [Adlercreutzia sp. ZJ138]
MTEEFIDIAYKTGAGRYIQEPGALSRLAKEVRRFGTKPFLIGGEHAFAAARDVAVASLRKARMEFVDHMYAGYASHAAAKQFAAEAREAGCDVVVGMGGGRIMDFAKAIAEYAGVPIIEAPTSIATCAAFSPLSILYTERGEFGGTWRYEHEINAVLVDTQVMACQPARLVAAGMMDSMAKLYEITNGSPTFDATSENVQRFCAYEHARLNCKLLLEYGPKAYADVQQRRLTDAVERVTFVNLALTGIVSSLTRGFHQTALAHKFYDGMRTYFTKEAAPYLHGELVAIGLLIQVVYNNTPDEVSRLTRIMRAMDMPCTLADLGIRADDPRLAVLHEYVGTPEFVQQDEASTDLFDRAFAGVVEPI